MYVDYVWQSNFVNVSPAL